MENKISKEDLALNMCINHLNDWVCSSCATNGADKPSAIFRSLRNKGYVFEETSTGRYDKRMFCPICEKTQTHYKLLSDDPDFDVNCENQITQKQCIRIMNILGNIEAYNLWKINTKPHIDHKEPLSRIGQFVNPDTLSDEEIKEQYQILTHEHNALKEKACKHCMKYGVRPPFMGKKFYYEGDDIYRGTCEGCGWYDGIKWTNELNQHLKRCEYLEEELENLKKITK